MCKVIGMSAKISSGFFGSYGARTWVVCMQYSILLPYRYPSTQVLYMAVVIYVKRMAGIFTEPGLVRYWRCELSRRKG